MKHKKLHIVHEVGVVYKRPLFESMPKIQEANQIYTLMLNFVEPFSLDLKEFFWVVLLQNGRVLGITEISKGDLTATVVNIREIVQLAILSNATSIVLCHNHPSGRLEPSLQDKQITEKVQSCCELFDVKLLDHLIISSEGFVAFTDLGHI